MKKIFASIFLSGLVTLSFSQQQKRGEDGNLFTEAPPVQTIESKLCGKSWTWIEGVEGNQKYESAVFSFKYEKDGTFTYNQRSEKNYWKIEGNFLIHSVLPFDTKAKQKFGIFSGKYEIAKITDSVLCLVKVNGDKNNKATVLNLELDAPVKWPSENKYAGAPFDSKYVITAPLPDYSNWEITTDPGTLIYTKKLSGYIYQKMVYRTGGTEYFKNGNAIDQKVFEKETL